jgi:oligopeptide transport system ATP-binding protein
VAVVLISHDLGAVRQVCDDVVVMHAGVVVERGPTDVVLSSPQHPVTRALRDSVPRPGWRPGEPPGMHLPG